MRGMAYSKILVFLLFEEQSCQEIRNVSYKKSWMTFFEVKIEINMLSLEEEGVKILS